MMTEVTRNRDHTRGSDRLLVHNLVSPLALFSLYQYVLSSSGKFAKGSLTLSRVSPSRKSKCEPLDSFRLLLRLVLD